MPKPMNRRTAFATMAAGYAAMQVPLPIGDAKAAVPADLGANDQRIFAWAAELEQIDARNSRLLDVADKRYDADPEDSPLAGYYWRLHDRSLQLMRDLRNTPADSVKGLGAKVRVTRWMRPPDPGLGYDGIDYKALLEVERLAGEA